MSLLIDENIQITPAACIAKPMIRVIGTLLLRCQLSV
jgi:hypothetical protein